MRILQVISHYLPAISFGGPLRVAHGLGRALVEQGHEVTVCCTNLGDPQTNLDLPVGQPVVVDSIRVIYEKVPVLRYWGFSPALARRVFDETARVDAVFTHFHYQFASMIGGWCARYRAKPLVVFTHGSLNKHGILARHSVLKRFYLNICEVGNFRNALFVAYHTEEERAQSIQFGKNTLIIPIGVDIDSFDRAPVRGEFRAQHPYISNRFLFLYLGRLADGKGLDLLIPALYQLIEAGKDTHLVIVGGDERGYLQGLRKQVHHLKLTGRVTFTGILDGNHKLAALRDADAFVLPSRSEGTSIVTLEAMAMRLPVIITDRVGLWREVVSNNCGLVVPYDGGAVSKAMGEMMTRTDRATMGQRGYDLVRTNYNWAPIARDLVDQIFSMQSAKGRQ